MVTYVVWCMHGELHDSSMARIPECCDELWVGKWIPSVRGQHVASVACAGPLGVFLRFAILMYPTRLLQKKKKKPAHLLAVLDAEQRCVKAAAEDRGWNADVFTASSCQALKTLWIPLKCRRLNRSDI